ncbi:unnamed protein product [Urochloa humidicola]
MVSFSVFIYMALDEIHIVGPSGNIVKQICWDARRGVSAFCLSTRDVVFCLLRLEDDPRGRGGGDPQVLLPNPDTAPVQSKSCPAAATVTAPQQSMKLSSSRVKS